MNSPFKGTYSRFQALQNAALHFHKTQSASEAQTYLRDQFRKHFQSPAGQKSRPSFESQLVEYITLFGQRGVKVLDTRYQLELDLPAHLATQISCSGQLPVLCTTPATGDMEAWLYSKDSSFSQTELRLPLMQAEIARRMQADLDEVTVGFYHFLSGSFTAFQFTQSEVDSAHAELQNLLIQIV